MDYISFEEKDGVPFSGVGHEDGGHSGRYPWGSGKTPYQHGEQTRRTITFTRNGEKIKMDSEEWLEEVRRLRKEGIIFTDKNGNSYYGDTAIAKSMGLTTGEFRIYESVSKNEIKNREYNYIRELRDEGKTPTEIGRIVGKNESTIRGILANTSENTIQAQKTADILRDFVDKNGMTDVGDGVERRLGISRTRMNEALYILKNEGYEVWGGGMPQPTNPGQQTNIKVLCPPGTPHKAIYDYGKVKYFPDPSENYISYDGGNTFKPSFQYPASMDSKRLMVRYPSEGGAEKDGVIEIRRGVADLSLGDANYAQVRILVDDTHYMKGMALYSDDMPPGIDVIYNTHYPDGTPALGPKNNTVLKPIKKDPDNPFGSAIKERGGQSEYLDKDGIPRLSLINKRSDEGDWDRWANKLPAQFLSKQSKTLVKNQLDLSIADKESQLEEILSLTNPTIKKKMLQDFADECDSQSVHLYAAALPRQHYQVILPLTTIKDDEVYAPNYKNGEKIALIRFPHAGTFEIPILTVNNKLEEGTRVIGLDSKDAVGINSKVAARLSGADFDGDTVMAIPCNSSSSKVKIESRPQLKGLVGFDDQEAYPYQDGIKLMSKDNTQKQMGIISNLITDMQIKGANDDEMARAARHSMVIIDAEKHRLNYKKSEKDNNIAELKEKYQGRYNEKTGRMNYGAATIISRAKSETPVLKRQGSGKIDPDTGKMIYKLSDKLYYQEVTKTVKDEKTGELKEITYKKTVYPNNPATYDPNKEIKQRTQKSTKMAETDDAFTLVSEVRQPIELLYADYANKLKALANTARKEKLYSGNIEYNPEAKKKYANEVNSLTASLNIALKNAPKERQASALANARLKQIISEDPELKSDKAEYKKRANKEMLKAREEVGAKRVPVTISDKEWEAIQAGAIHETTLQKILQYADSDKLKERATPKKSRTLSDIQINRLKHLQISGYSNSEIAEILGCSTSTIAKYSVRNSGENK